METGNGQSDGQSIAIVGAGTIGLSFAALHLAHTLHEVTIFDTRPDLDSYVSQTLPTYLPTSFSYNGRLHLADSLKSAVKDAHIIQECLPEDAELKVALWQEVERFCHGQALLWSATSGIPASLQASQMTDKTRLVVCHPFNPPMVMPLIEVVPAPSTSQAAVEAALAYWRRVGKSPVVVKEECTGFVANRLAFALFREAVSLVERGVVTVEEVDKIVETSMGPRWAVAGPFKSYHAGGGSGGLGAFMRNIGGTVGRCWDDQGKVVVGGGWEEEICRQTEEAYGVVDVAKRDRITKRILGIIEEERKRE